MTLLAALVHLVLAGRELIPTHAGDDWFAFLSESESAHSAHWDMEFPEDQPLRVTFLLSDYVSLQRITRPSLHALAAFLAKGRVYDNTDVNRVVQLLDDAIAPENTIFQAIADEFRAGRLSTHITHAFFNSVRDLINYLPANRHNVAWSVDFLPEDPASASLLIPHWFAIPRGPHEDSLEGPYPVQSMSAFDSVWHWWRRIQAEYSQLGETSSPRHSGSAGSRTGTYSPHYEPFTPPDRSVTPILGPTTPPAQTGPSAVGSASFDIRQLLGSTKKDPPTPRKASVIAASPSNSTEMQRGAPPVHPAPTGSSQKSITPPTSEAYNEEGEEEKEDEEEEEEEEPPRPVKRQRTGPAPSKSKGSGKGKGKGKARANTPAALETSDRFPIPVCKTHGKSKKGELPAYVPPQPVPMMDTVTLAAEMLANQRREPTVVRFGQPRLLTF
ncbi:hypothetical protein B0H14DRAFT_2600461 [Mycena olivaceomarginata]|nr:hypothetical protein B0H14DRAFT_2600461 [Mycena olivaceomarginata]